MWKNKSESIKLLCDRLRILRKVKKYNGCNGIRIGTEKGNKKIQITRLFVYHV